MFLCSCIWCNNFIFVFFQRFYDTLRRKNYVTPTSYLELILTFKTLLNLKRDELMGLKNRYLVGLEKLDFAASQVNKKYKMAMMDHKKINWRYYTGQQNKSNFNTVVTWYISFININSIFISMSTIVLSFWYNFWNSNKWLFECKIISNSGWAVIQF